MTAQPEPPASSDDTYACHACGTAEDTCQASPQPCCIVCAELNTSPHVPSSR